MKQAFAIIILSTFLSCNNSGSSDTTIDSLGNRAGDTTSRNDTMYYERMTNKTGGADTGSNISGTKRQDTTYYERSGNKIRPDSSR